MKKTCNSIAATCLTLLLLCSIFFLPTVTFAQTADKLGIGTLDVPPAVQPYNTMAQSKGGGSIGLIYFISNMIKLFTVLAGLYVLFNVVVAGYHLLNGGGDASAFEKVRNQITQSAIGLLLILVTYTITAIIGLVFFGDPSFILNPKIL